jgi:hypothetical protein
MNGVLIFGHGLSVLHHELKNAGQVDRSLWQLPLEWVRHPVCKGRRYAQFAIRYDYALRNCG